MRRTQGEERAAAEALGHAPARDGEETDVAGRPRSFRGRILRVMDTNDVLAGAFGGIEEVVQRAVDGLDAQALTFRPDPGANSISWLVWHLTRVQDDHVSELAGVEQAYVAGGWAERLGLTVDIADTGYGHTPEQVAAVAFEDPEDLLAYHQAVSERTRAYLRTVDADELERIVDRRWDPPVTAGVRLGSVISDCLQHAGQAAYVRGIHERTS